MPKTLKYIEAVPKPNGKVLFLFWSARRTTLALPGPYNSTQISGGILGTT